MKATPSTTVNGVTDSTYSATEAVEDRPSVPADFMSNSSEALFRPSTADFHFHRLSGRWVRPYSSSSQHLYVRMFRMRLRKPSPPV